MRKNNSMERTSETVADQATSLHFLNVALFVIISIKILSVKDEECVSEIRQGDIG